jgi:hypothetical protein
VSRTMRIRFMSLVAVAHLGGAALAWAGRLRASRAQRVAGGALAAGTVGYVFFPRRQAGGTASAEGVAAGEAW